MRPQTPECPACRVRLEEGFVFEHAQKGEALMRWVAGKPEKSWGSFQVKERPQFDINTVFRCPKCGWVIWFAPAPDAAGE